jgi:hypothetical protein
MPLPAFLGRLFGRQNIHLPSWQPKPWDPDHVAGSLGEMLKYAEQNAQATIDWYWDKKRWKAIASRVCRLGTILFTAAAALIPIVGATGWFGPSDAAQHALWSLRLNQAGYLSLGFAALALALDRFMSGSTSWMRYVSTATSIQTAVEQFRLDWDKQLASLAGRIPSGQDLVVRISRITEFSITVRALVENETKAWVAEFQANLAELQKSTAAAVETARAQVQAAQQKVDAEQQAAQQKTDAERQAGRPGGIDLTVTNAADTDEGYEVVVDGRSEKADVTSSTCGILGIPPGLHDLSVRAKIEGIPAHASQLVTITAGAATKMQLTLAKQKRISSVR